MTMKLLAKGNTAEIYEYGDNLVCKMFYPNYPAEYIEHEFTNANLVWKLGIRTPKAHEIIKEDNRQGIVFDRVFGEELSTRFFSANEMEKDLLLDRFVGFHKQLMQYYIDEAISYKDFLRMLSSDDETNSKISALEDRNCFIHGDFHLNNVLVDDNNDFVLIDMMNVCKGTKLYDVARTYFLLSYDKSIQAKYLEKMGCSVQDIRPYLDVIQEVRAKELNI